MNNLSNLLTKSSILILALFALTFTACDDDEGNAPDEQELITTVRMDFFELNTTDTLSFTISDPDGDGGNAPTVEEIKLKANTTYVFHTIFSDESDAANVVDFSQEIVDEAEEHQVCYTISGNLLQIIIGDQDSNAKPIGLIGGLTTLAANSGTMKVVLKHEPDKAAADPCATGETDVEVTFPVVVE